MTSTPPPARRPLPEISRVRTVHLQAAKDAGERFTMLTSYDVLTADLFDAAGVDVLLVGDSAGNTVLGHETTLPVSLEIMATLGAAVVRGATRALVVVDLPFGSYEESPEQAVRSSVRLLRETGAHAVKMEAGAALAEHVAAVVRAGIPVMGHVGFTPQSEHALGGYRVQGRGEGARQVLADARAVEAAGAFALVLEMVTDAVAREVEAELRIPSIGIGAGAGTSGQVLVWQDMLGLRRGRVPRFVKQYAQLAETVTDAVGEYVRDVRSGTFPGPEHTFTD